MRIALIGFGIRKIPDKYMGSVENLIWNYKIELERLGHIVDIYNSIWVQETIYTLNQTEYDFIHLHSDVHTLYFLKHLKKPFCLTSHFGGFWQFKKDEYKVYPGYNYLLQDSLLAPGLIALSDQVSKLYQLSNYKGFLKTLRNPVEADKFKFLPEAKLKKAICIGTIQPRKSQAYLSKIASGKVQIDFVGEYDKSLEPNFIENATCKYLGRWPKYHLYNNLTQYSAMVLLSKSEAAPLSVLEALSAGLSLVISRSASANLDTNSPFITVIEDEENKQDYILGKIQQAIENNHKYRQIIRNYAQGVFNYQVVVKEYLQIIEEFKSWNSNN